MLKIDVSCCACEWHHANPMALDKVRVKQVDSTAKNAYLSCGLSVALDVDIKGFLNVPEEEATPARSKQKDTPSRHIPERR